MVGHYDRRLNTIYIDPRTSCRTQRCTIVHELIHWEDDDGPCANDWLNNKRELRVEAETARRLISIDAVVDGLLWCIDHSELAEHWDVDVHLVMLRLEVLTDEEQDIITFFVDAEEEFIVA
ncbi:hypothetical protein ASF21_12220 [Arthrobacter sp. Leaf234]|uniref:hypothetical protein n=1 Tax=Arthrobacter sp. Leaf234 TaxID=1736303 RepID=UPI0006F42249|nr:hypothetical protein [Arthrobacter sp. Leaf234]KQN99583.1 hypothetical protein ASF21_12220 [Arthrobacter sp. Leaf234]